jgi:hypothetical protein
MLAALPGRWQTESSVDLLILRFGSFFGGSELGGFYAKCEPTRSFFNEMLTASNVPTTSSAKGFDTRGELFT